MTRREPRLTIQDLPAPEGSTVLALGGDLVLTNVDLLRDAVEAAVAEGRDRVVLDFRGIVHVDTVGLALLVRLEERCEDAGGSLVVAGLPRTFDEIVERLYLRRRLRIVDSVESALESPGR